MRTFSDLTAFDFVATIASGSLLASAAVATSWDKFLQPLLSISAILAVQAGLAVARRRSRAVCMGLSNTPLFLFSDGDLDESAMKHARLTKADIWAKMREANLLTLEEVCAIVLETTGDISVVHGAGVDPGVLTGVK